MYKLIQVTFNMINNVFIISLLPSAASQIFLNGMMKGVPHDGYGKYMMACQRKSLDHNSVINDRFVQIIHI